MKSEFGKLSGAYSFSRKNYPEEVIDYIISLVNKNSKVLDIGCGTGIATRQLAERGFQVFACDIDEKMIDEAKKYPKKNINYFVADVKKLPFDKEIFDLVTAFGAFHWFYDEHSMVEIKRVMKKDSFFCVANKNDMGNFKKDFSNIIKKIIGKHIISAKDNYNPMKIFKKYDFRDIKESKMATSEYFTIEKALLHFQSMHLWNYVPPEFREEVLKLLSEHFTPLAENGFVKREIEIVTVVGKR